MRIRHALVAALIPATLISIPSQSAYAAPAVRLTYVQYDSPGTDTGTNRSLNAEWVRIKNFSSTRKTLSGWTLRDRQGHVYRFGTFRLGAGKSVRVHTGSGTNTATDRYWRRGWYVWNNTGDRATLKNRAGTTVDTCRWGDGDGTTSC